MFGWYQNCFYLCTRFSEVKYSGCSAVRLAHLLWEQGVVGSNPATPTIIKAVFTLRKNGFYYCRGSEQSQTKKGNLPRLPIFINLKSNTMKNTVQR